MISWLVLSLLSSAQQVQYSRDIQPILSSSCFTCHGRDPSSRKEDLRLDSFDFATAERESGFPLVPGDPEASLIWQRINAKDLDDIMPPLKSKVHDQLIDEQRRLIYDWIKQGAKYEKHWAFIPPQRSDVPDGANPIDHFIQQRSAKTETHTLIRRLFIDVTGLPPTLEEYDLFTGLSQDERINKLFSTPVYQQRYAERMATPWLDASRYGDTIGTHTDAGRQMWKWRDWVLEAYRSNMPFDQFTYEQLAGDLIENGSLSQKVASGFNRNHVITDEGGAINEEYLVEYAAERTNTTGEVFLGLAMGCARCHDHKFNPITQEDFFSMFAYFNSNDEPGLYSQEGNNPTRAFEPMISVPSSKQQSQLELYGVDIAAVEALLAKPSPKDAVEFVSFLDSAQSTLGVQWYDSTISAASTSSASTISFENNTIVLSGENPSTDEHFISLDIAESSSNMLLFEFSNGRAANGNVVLSSIEAECVSLADPTQWNIINFNWAWADYSQDNADWEAVNVLDDDDKTGWAPAAHMVEGGRNLLLMADAKFGYAGGSQIKITLRYKSVHAQHVYGQATITAGDINTDSLDLMPIANSRWYGTWPYTPTDRYSGYDQIFGPEADATIDFEKKYAPDSYSWVLVAGVKDNEVFNGLPAGEKVSFAGKKLYVPSARNLEVSLSSDDGVQVFLNGKMVFENRIDRGATPDSDTITLELLAGINTVVMKIVNTGGIGGMYWSPQPSINELSNSLVWSIIPQSGLQNGVAGLHEKLSGDWRLLHSPEYRAQTTQLSKLNVERDVVEAAIPKTMVMSELAEPRQAYVLTRGEYDQADLERPVSRGVPAELGSVLEDAPNDRRGLAQWLVSPENPLTARVYVNRLWQMVFGTGIVATPNDFGVQGAWPSHPELLDWLAVEFIECGWDIQHILKIIYSSETYQQSSVTNNDAGGGVLSYFPRQRMGAEEIRDQALFLSGLLVEELGGVSVKPYQPDGLWKEVSMPQSNTSTFVRGEGNDLYRRSLYTYWKRASPPPSLLMFDAPTREFCTITRGATNTPLQALVLWNDVQYVEAARMLAQQMLLLDAPQENDADHWRLTELFKTCTGREPSDEETSLLYATLSSMRAKFETAPEDALSLLEYGEAMVDPTLDPSKLAAYTLVANTILSLDEVINKN